MQVGFSNDHRAGFAQSRDNGCVAIGDMPGAYSRSRTGGLAGDIDEILDRDRHAVKWATGDATATLFVDRTRGVAGAVSVDMDKRVCPLAVLGDGRKALFDLVDGSDHQERKAQVIARPQRSVAVAKQGN